ncbi:hypothetical protein AZI86_02820 [Bdellovibrio bacteriovorus]|uniref:Secreted protein n=1 Tax=Bdellovibrio bacteriovorus TaxID=959 RepID=A0A150WNP6_BDEBC|nr:hypothetical protein [Bdellovibrio bacteriovorus]KYG66018.1 hypothetical protein AZI86_02820 [Bdellovibrio bacteriovorus]
MRLRLILILFSLCFSLQAFAQNPNHVDIIFDIDWTAFYSVDEAHRDEKTVLVEGKLYRPTDYFIETVEWLLSRHPLKAVPSLGTFNFQKTFDPLKATESFFPASREAWSLERNKAARIPRMLPSHLKDAACCAHFHSYLVEKSSDFSPLIFVSN